MTKKDTLLSYLKTLKVVPQKTNRNSYRLVYTNSCVNRILKNKKEFEIIPNPSNKEINEVIKWLKENNLRIPYLKEGELDYLVKIN